LALDMRVGRDGAPHARGPLSGENLLGFDEEHAARLVADSRAGREAAARKAAEVRLAGLEALVVREFPGQAVHRVTG